MKQIYYLPSCSTCQRILKEIAPPKDYRLRDIKNDPITEQELDELKALSGSYEALFSKRAMLYKSLNLSEKSLTEQDFKHYILEHYTFLKRPVVVSEDAIFIGNAPKVVAQAKMYLLENK